MNTAIRFDIVSASLWSWVTYTTVTPRFSWMCLISYCICSRRFLSRAPQRLIHQHQVGIEDQCSRHGDPLGLAAGQLGRAAVTELAELDHFQRTIDAAFALGLVHLAHLQREREVFRHRHVRKQRIILEHHADAALVGRDAVDRLVLEEYFPVGCGLESREHHEAGGLAGARGSPAW